ncbi:hypothetical protein HRbin36_01292 [bacterium HR36]|nr:hypothetical protein HRbin36_01292 [bacterium HR36]
MGVPNTIVWVDIPVTDLDRAVRFYSAVLGQTVTKENFGGSEFALLPHAEDNVCGCLVCSDDNRPSGSGPLIYLNVEGRLDAAIAAVSVHGGRVLQGKHSIGPYGFRAIIQDSEGNRLALHSKLP